MVSCCRVFFSIKHVNDAMHVLLDIRMQEMTVCRPGIGTLQDTANIGVCVCVCVCVCACVCVRVANQSFKLFPA